MKCSRLRAFVAMLAVQVIVSPCKFQHVDDVLSTLEESTKFQHVADDRVDNSRVYDIYDGHNGMGIIII